MLRATFVFIHLAIFFLQQPLFSTQIYQTPLFPAVLEQWIEDQHRLPNYTEANYSPLGRSAVVDALLGDPYYIPVYAETVSKKLKSLTRQASLFAMCRHSFIAGGIPESEEIVLIPEVQTRPPPKDFLDVFGANLGEEMYRLWRAFISVYRECEEILSPIQAEEKEWILNNREAFFFGYQGNTDYDFFTTESPLPLKFFELASRVDLARLTDCSKKLALIVDEVVQSRGKLSSITLENDFTWEEEGITFIISNRRNTLFKENRDFFIHLAGNSVFTNNSGGTEGKRPAALQITLEGNNLFLGKKYCQGTGVLGVGVLANFGGNNTYKAESYSQGAGFFGAGILMDNGGNNDYQIGYFGQSCALFGASMLWNRGGQSRYVAHDGMAQGASSTLGVAFLIDGAGSSVYTLGRNDAGSYTRGIGIGQGSSVGVRFEPWKGNPSFYGGVSFLYTGGGNNFYNGSWYSQGSAYFLGAGILVDEGCCGKFNAEINSQGQGLHLAAGLLLSKGKNTYFQSGWGSMGVGGDRSCGMLIATEAGGDFKGADQTLGTSRKPQALGIFFNLQGDSSYFFQNESAANIQLPSQPTEWSQAMFLNIGKQSFYPESADTLIRCHNCLWHIEGKGIGIDKEGSAVNSFEKLLSILPQTPRIKQVFDPISGWKSNTAFRPLKVASTYDELKNQIRNIPNSSFEGRRRLYECLDLYRFLNPGSSIDLSVLLNRPGDAPEDQINYAILWALNERNHAFISLIEESLRSNQIASPYARRMAIKYLGTLDGTSYAQILANVMENDPSQENRSVAAFFLARNADDESVKQLRTGLAAGSEQVRFAIAYGLQDNPLPQSLELVSPLLNDPSFYVRRAAAMAAISLHYKPAITILLDTLNFPTLDTTENYGDNLYSQLAKYVGVNFGIDKEAWISWWEKARFSFEFPTAKEPPCIP